MTGILIATRNRATQLLLSLQSLRKRAYGVPILIVDDGSTDQTLEVIRRFDDMQLRVVTINREGPYRKNPSAVLNFGHEQMPADIVIEQGGEICHVTDCVTPLSEVCRPGVVALARVHHGTPQEYVTLCNNIYPFPADYAPKSVRTNGDTWPVPRVNGYRLYTGIERPAPFIFCGAIHKSDFEAIGGYDETIDRNNDGDLAERLQQHGVRFVFVGRAVAFHLEHPKC